jgi:hypothetical protein
MRSVMSHRRQTDDTASTLRQTVAGGQALYFLVTGIWPLVHMPSFLRVTGPKTDLWLVRTVGALIAVVGAVIGRAALRRRITPDIALLATGSSAALTAIDVIYVAKGRIAPIYLLDAAGEVVLIAGWVISGGTGVADDS